MYKRVLETLIVFGIFISPLLHASTENLISTRTMWSGLIFISCSLIVFFLAYPLRVHVFSKLFIGIASIICVSSLFFATYPSNAFALYIFLLAILLCSAIGIIIKDSAKNTLIVSIMLLGCFVLYAQWGVAQFIVQHNLGLHKIGEPIITTNIPGVASFYIGLEKFIRAYGPFGHANSFAGVLLLGIIILYRHKNALHHRLFVQTVLFVLSLGIAVSFSRTALVGLALMSILFIRKKAFSLVIPLCVLVIVFFPLFFYRSVNTRGAAAHERIVGFTWFTDIMSIKNNIKGIGLGNYTKALSSYITNKNIAHNPWDIAPVHSTPLLLFAELGVVPFLLLCALVIRYITSHRAWVLLVLTPALFLDHYFATQLSPFIFLITSAILVVY